MKEKIANIEKLAKEEILSVRFKTRACRNKSKVLRKKR